MEIASAMKEFFEANDIVPDRWEITMRSFAKNATTVLVHGAWADPCFGKWERVACRACVSVHPSCL